MNTIEIEVEADIRYSVYNTRYYYHTDNNEGLFASEYIAVDQEVVWFHSDDIGVLFLVLGKKSTC